MPTQKKSVKGSPLILDAAAMRNGRLCCFLEF